MNTVSKGEKGSWRSKEGLQTQQRRPVFEDRLVVRWVGQKELQVTMLSLGKETGREEGALRRPVGMTFFPPPGFDAPHQTRGDPLRRWWCATLGRPWYPTLLGEPHQRSHE